MSFTYDTTALSGSGAAANLARTRLLLTDTADTEKAPCIFFDAEVEYFLTLADDDPIIAAAIGYETWARSRGKLARVLETGVLGTSRFKAEQQAMRDLLDAAKNLRDSKLRGSLQTALITSDDQDFLDEYRPQWRTVTAVAVVE